MIQVYSRDGCAACLMVKRYLDQKNFSYEEINLSQQPERAKEIEETIGLSTVPVTVVRTRGKQTVVRGWNPTQLIPALIPLDIERNVGRVGEPTATSA